MTIEELQHAIGVKTDGQWGPVSKAALLARFTNLSAPAITPDQQDEIAQQLGCTARQVCAVAAVESSGGGFDKAGRPKILFERHIFHRLTNGKYDGTPYSNAAGGGYAESSWDKLLAACGKDVDAAFASCSWGKFQVLGTHWSKLSYASPYELAASCVTGEAAHYELLARYCRTFGLLPAIRKISGNPEDCRDFASGYNGPAYRNFNYHVKLAEAFS